MSIGERIREERLRRAMSQTDLALDVGTHQARVSDWERGVYEPLASTLRRLAKALRCSSDRLLEMDKEWQEGQDAQERSSDSKNVDWSAWEGRSSKGKAWRGSDPERR